MTDFRATGERYCLIILWNGWI